MSDTTQQEEAEIAQMDAFVSNVMQLIGAAGMTPAMASFALLWAAAHILSQMNGKARKGAPHKLKGLIEGAVMERKQQARINKQTEDWERSHG